MSGSSVGSNKEKTYLPKFDWSSSVGPLGGHFAFCKRSGVACIEGVPLSSLCPCFYFILTFPLNIRFGLDVYFLYNCHKKVFRTNSSTAFVLYILCYFVFSCSSDYYFLPPSHYSSNTQDIYPLKIIQDRDDYTLHTLHVDYKDKNRRINVDEMLFLN